MDENELQKIKEKIEEILTENGIAESLLFSGKVIADSEIIDNLIYLIKIIYQDEINKFNGNVLNFVTAHTENFRASLASGKLMYSINDIYTIIYLLISKNKNLPFNEFVLIFEKIIVNIVDTRFRLLRKINETIVFLYKNNFKHNAKSLEIFIYSRTEKIFINSSFIFKSSKNLKIFIEKYLTSIELGYYTHELKEMLKSILYD